MAFKVLATARSFCTDEGPHHEFLSNHDCGVVLHPPQNPMMAEELCELIAGFDGVILGLDQCDRAVLAQADRLRVISRYGSGVDRIDLASATQYGIVVTNTPGVNRIAVAELTIGLMFSLARSIPHVVMNTRNAVWERVRGWELTGKTLRLIGFGNIGNPLLTLDNFLGTLHMGGTSQESVYRMAMLAAQNAVAVLRGQPCEYVVNPAALESNRQGV